MLISAYVAYPRRFRGTFQVTASVRKPPSVARVAIRPGALCLTHRRHRLEGREGKAEEQREHRRLGSIASSSHMWRSQ